MTTTLLLDMDGPLADFDRHFWERCGELGFTFDIERMEDQLHRFFTDHMPRHMRDDARKVVEAPGWFAELPPTPGAEDGVYELIDAGVDIWVCTKPLEANPTCLNDKAAWLGRYFPELVDHLITAPDKSMIRGDILLDDAIKLDWIESADWAHLPRWSWGDPVDALLAHSARV